LTAALAVAAAGLLAAMTPFTVTDEVLATDVGCLSLDCSAALAPGA